MSLRHLCALSLSAGVVWIAACSGGSASSACGDYLNALVSYEQKCGNSTATVDDATKSNFEAICGALSSAPGANNFSGQVEQCASQVNSLSCDGSLACPIHGTLADGAPCGASPQCTGGICTAVKSTNPNSEFACSTCSSYLAIGANCSTGECDPSTSACSNNTCVAYVGQGQSCASAPCSTGLQCDMTTKVCQPYPTKGQTCTLQCANPYRCIGGTCADAVQQGGACPTGIECANNLMCDPQSHTCVQPTLAALGQPCGFVNTQYVQCQTGLKCSTGGQPNTCFQPKSAGQACTVGNGECQTYLYCINGTCQTPDYSTCK